MITSARNPRLKELKRLRDARHRERTGLFLAEGEDMLAEALRFGAAPEVVFFDGEALSPDDEPLRDVGPDVELVAVGAAALAAAGTLGSGSRLIGVWRQRWRPRAEAPGRDGAAAQATGAPVEAAVYLHEVADPGNVGAVLRSALALLPSAVVLSPGTADPFGPKAVRASMGAVFGEPVVRGSLDEAREAAGREARAIALVPERGTPLREAVDGRAVVFCIGAERTGLPAEIVAACDEVAHVPMRSGGAESLNVAMTATLCLYESAVHRLSARHA